MLFQSSFAENHDLYTIMGNLMLNNQAIEHFLTEALKTNDVELICIYYK